MINVVASGAGDMTAATTTSSITIPSVDLRRAFVLISGRTDFNGNSLARDYMFEAELTDSTTLEITRGSATRAGSYVYQVVECDNQEFNVQKIVDNIPSLSNSKAVTIPYPIDPERTMVIATRRSSQTTAADENEAYGTAKIEDAETLRLLRAFDGANAARVFITAYVIEWSLESNVKVFDGTIEVDETIANPKNFTHSGTDITTANTFMITQGNHEQSTLESVSMKATFDSSAVILERYGAAVVYNSDIHYQLVRFPQDICYQYEDDMALADFTEDTPITTVDLDHSIVVTTNSCAGTGTAFGRQIVTVKFLDDSTIQTERGYSGQPLEQAFSVVDFSTLEHNPDIDGLAHL